MLLDTERYERFNETKQERCLMGKKKCLMQQQYPNGKVDEQS